MRHSDVLLVLPSRMSSVAELEGFVNQLMVSCKLTRELQGNLLITLTEAVTNAIRHGNQLAEDKCVRIEVWRKRNELRVVVKDEGVGFEPSSLPDPTSPDRREVEGGRGVFLMRSLSDEIKFAERGTAVEMCFTCNRPFYVNA